MRSSRQRRNSKIYNLAWNKMGGLTFDYSNCRRKGHVALSEERLRSVFGAASFVLSSTADQQEFNLVVGECPLWVKSRHMQCTTACPLYTRKRTFAVQLGMFALGQKRTLPYRHETNVTVDSEATAGEPACWCHV